MELCLPQVVEGAMRIFDVGRKKSRNIRASFFGILPQVEKSEPSRDIKVW
jgi:hypothetical protein